MQVIIAEKPSVAREIAAIVGAKSRKDGFIEGNGYAVTWAFGHLVGLVMPEEYGIQGFKAENLPIMPQTFILKPRQTREGKTYKNDPGAVKQLEIIKGLFAKADRIIVATDAGREGELIFRFIYTYLKCNKPFVRLWISSLTDRAIREGLQNLRPGSDYDHLYASAKARSEADWLVGINASQALAIAAGRGVWSLGRVQTPTLAILCSRYQENKDFKSQAYFRLKVHTAKDTTTFAVLSADKYDTRPEADEVLQRVCAAGWLRVTNIEKKEVKQEPPLLYDLTTLQKDMNSKHGFSAEKTLDIAQKLYEAKLITYPRTGSRYIPEDMLLGIYPLLNSLFAHPGFIKEAAAVSNSELNRRSVDDKKVTDHHALLVTTHTPESLPPEEQLVYDRIAGRVIEAFGKPCIKDATTVTLACGDAVFGAKGSVIKQAGWRKIWGNTDEETQDEDVTTLPTLKVGDTLPVCDTEVLEKQTKPRPLHTEASLLSSMESCGKECENEDEREAMKESGIGTPATRAAIIETLLSREYIRREKKSLIPTEKGLSVYEVVKDKRIADVAMTGEWELALSRIATGEMDAFSFHRGIEVYTAQITSELLATRIERTDNRASAICPRCSKPVVFYPKTAKCLNPDCGLLVFRSIAHKELSDTQLTDLFQHGRTGLIKGFKSSSGNSFDAAVTFDKEYKTVFDFPKTKPGGAGKSSRRK